MDKRGSPNSSPAFLAFLALSPSALDLLENRGVRVMKTSAKRALFMAAFLTAAGFAPAAIAEDDYCRWGNEESMSIRCFDCMRRVWTGYEWRLVNTCGPHYGPLFFGWR